MSEENGYTFIGYQVVCLIDVLGQKQKLARWRRLPDGGQTNSDFNEAIRSTVGTVLTFRDEFVNYFKRLSQCTIPDQLAALPKDQQEKYQRIQDCDVHVERFSDTFVFSSQIRNAHGDASVIPVYRILATCCYAMLISLAAKTPVRGAITIGTGKILEDKSFYGPALAEAHYLESEVTNQPRVIISPTVHEFLAEGQAYSENREVTKDMGKIARTCRSLIYKDVDGCQAVDFIGKGVRDMLDADTGAAKAVNIGYEFVRNEAEKFRQSGNTKLAVRYHLLRQYMESRLPLW